MKESSKIIFVMAIFLLGFSPLLFLLDRPEDFKVDTPKFAGKIAYSEDASPPKGPTVDASFSSTKEWGGDGIMTFRFTKRGIAYTAWRPCPASPGTFEVASQTNEANWPFVWFASVDKQVGKDTFLPPKYDIGYFMMSFMTFNILSGLTAYFLFRKKKPS